MNQRQGQIEPQIGAAQLLATTFIAGLVSLALELAASRLLAPAFGTTELIWAVVIGMILLYFSAGYALGGRWADRNPSPGVLYTALAIAGITIAIIPIVARPLLTVAARGMQAFSTGVIAGPFVVILVLFAAPVTLLACVQPFAVRLAVRNIGSGRLVGGSVCLDAGKLHGTFLPNLVLIPNLGPRRTFRCCDGLRSYRALGLWRTRPPVLAVRLCSLRSLG